MLLGLAAAGWVVFLNQAGRPMGMGRAMGPDLTMGGSWPLFLVLIPLVVMNVAAMVAVALLVFVGKTVPHGRGIGLLAALVLIGCGGAVAAHPSLLPTVA